jgi:hypothetical protein
LLPAISFNWKFKKKWTIIICNGHAQFGITYMQYSTAQRITKSPLTNMPQPFDSQKDLLIYLYAKSKWWYQNCVYQKGKRIVWFFLPSSCKMSDKWNSLAADNVHLTIGMCQLIINNNIKGNMRNNTEIQLVIQHIV